MSSFSRFSYCFFHALREIQGIVYGLLGCLAFSAIAITYLEKIPFADALYFTLITGLTIGYGDIFPVTIGGRVVAVLTGLLGVLITGVMVAVAVYSLKETMKPSKDDH